MACTCWGTCITDIKANRERAVAATIISEDDENAVRCGDMIAIDQFRVDAMRRVTCAVLALTIIPF